MRALLTAFSLIVALIWAGPAAAEPIYTLPFPGDGSGAVFGTFTDANGATRDAILLDGVPVAFRYDTFWSYSVKLLAEIQDVSGGTLLPESQFGDYTDSTGTGGLDVLVYTFAAGQDNDSVGPGGTFDLADPVVNSGGGVTSFDDFWPDPGAADVNEQSQTVGELLAYLQAVDPDNTIPVFGLDLNQEGGDNSLLLAAVVYICPTSPCDAGNAIAVFPLDTTDPLGGIGSDGVFDSTAQALAFGQLCFAPAATDCADPLTWAGPTLSGNVYDVNHNVGSGNFDFAAFSPLLDLTLFDPAHFISVRGVLAGLNDGPEEFFITGTIGISQVEVAGPASLLLIATGLLGLPLARRSRRKP